MKTSINLLPLIIFTLFVSVQLNAQNTQNAPQIVPPAPNAAALAQYADVPVSKYSGVPNISIPIYTINTGGYQLPIILSYHASGIKVQQEASSTGLGWALNAGGVITRQIRGIDDFNSITDHKGFFTAPALPSYGSSMPADLAVLPNGNYYAPSIFDSFLKIDCPQSYTPELDDNYCTAILIADTESDLYSFNFGSYSGKFVVNKDGSTVLFSPESGIIIKVIDSNSWQATTNDGIIYKFTKKEYTTPYSFSQDQYGTNLPFAVGGSADFEYISSWYLSDILLTNGENITFNYTDLNTESWSYGPIAVNRAEPVYYHLGCDTGEHIVDNQRLESGNKQYSKSSSMNRIECYLKNISWNEGSVNFSYSNRDDIDTYSSISSQKLDAISIKKLDGTLLYNSDGTEISNIKFNYSYFNSQDYNQNYNFLSLRLKLDSLSIDDKKYGFNYINPNSLPKKYSNSTDHWGYFNNELNLSDITQNDIHGNPYKVPYFIPKMLVVDPTYFPQPQFYEGANRDANPTVLTNGMLASIQYPTKGLVSFEYEPNDFELNININTTSFGLLKYEDRYEDKICSATNYATSSDSCAGCYPPDTPNASFTLTKATNVSMEFKYTPYGSQTYSMPYGPFGLVTRIDDGGTFNKSFIFDPNWAGKIVKEDVLLDAGTYMIIATSQQNYNTSGIVKYTIDKVLPTSKKITGGGVRIKKIISEKNTKEFSYSQENDATKTSGLLLVEPNYGHISYTNFNCLFALIKESSPVHALSDSGATVGYSCIKENISDQGESSNIVSKYKNHIEFRSRGSNIPVMPAFDNGILLEELYQNNSRTVFKKTFNYENALVKRYELYETYFMRISFAFGFNSDLNYYRIMPEWWKLKSEITQNYFYDAAGTQSTMSSQIDYEYNVNTFQVNKTTTKDSKDVEIIQKTTYPTDYNSTIYNQMVSRNIIAQPIETITLVDGKVTKANLHTFKSTQLYPDGEIQIGFVPEFVYSFNDTNSPTESTFAKYNGLSPSLASYKEDLHYNTYDLRANLKEIITNGINTHSYLWGYNQNHPVAKIENATQAQIAALNLNMTLINDSSTTDSAMQIELQKLRTGLPNAMVTTYTYNPLIGVTSITDPKDDTITYTYDSFGRLQNVKDRDGNILSENEYHYKN